MLISPKNSCYRIGCSKFPVNKCKCAKEITYSCSEHIENHLKIVGIDHQISNVVISVVEGLSKTKSLIKIERFLIELDKARQITFNACNEIIMNLNQNMKKFLNKLMTMKFSMIKAKQRIQAGQPINDEFIKEIKIAETVHVDVNYKEIIEKMPEIFTLEVLEKERFILHAEPNDFNLYMIDCVMLKKIVVGNFNQHWSGSAACRVGKNEFFITGGCNPTVPSAHGNTSIINIKKMTQRVLESATSRCQHSCIFKDNQVYVFGGWDWISFLDSASKFDMNTKVWSDLPNIPVASINVASSLIDNKIIITGFQFNAVYVFNLFAYVKNLILTANYSYIACDKWLAGCDTLYECIDLNSGYWIKYNINFLGGCGSISLTCKRHKYIYFTNNMKIQRIDTEDKVVKQLIAS